MEDHVKTSLASIKNQEETKREGSELKIDALDLDLNVAFQKELEQSLILETIDNQSVDSVGSIIEGLGFQYSKIKGLSRKKFLVLFEDIMSDKDLDFL